MNENPKNIQEFFSNSQYHMANISAKVPTYRRAIAMGTISVGKEAFAMVKDQKLPKGDVLKLAEIAAIQGAKNAPSLIPLCHPLLLEEVLVYLELDEKSFSISAYTLVATYGKTGVEMEALAGVNAALLTLYDLIKPVQPSLVINNIMLLMKEGGKKGLWKNPLAKSNPIFDIISSKPVPVLANISSAVITMSDRAFNGTYEDRSGPALKVLLEENGAECVYSQILPDEKLILKKTLLELTNKNIQLVITTGGTGVSDCDITTQVLESICDKLIPGVGEMLRAKGAKHIACSWLSNSTAGIKDKTLIIALPGSTNAIRQLMPDLLRIIPHALGIIANNKDIHAKHDKSFSA